MRKETVAFIEDETRKQVEAEALNKQKEAIKNALKREKLIPEEIAEYFGVLVEFVQQINKYL